MGSRLEARLLYHKDGKSFSRKNFPRDTPRLAVGYLADESGSMSGMAINASISTGIILEDLCRRMELPCYIGGFTSSAGGLQDVYKRQNQRRARTCCPKAAGDCESRRIFR